MEIGWQRLGSQTLDGILRVDEGDVIGFKHVADLTACLCAKLQGQGVTARSTSLKLHGTPLGHTTELAPLLPTLRTVNLRWTLRVNDVPRPSSSERDDGMPHVLIKTLTGNTFSLHLPLNASVDEVKAMVAAKKGTPADQQRLIFASKQLEDGRTLAYHNITDGSVLHLILRMRGGGCAAAFVDVEDEDAMRTVAFASSAPRWRVVHKGLNLHGTCLNRACVAFKKEVIAPMGLKPFNIIAQQAFCPMCDRAIAARTCGFYNCEWRFEGVKAKTGVHVASLWKTLPSEDDYSVFDDDDSNMVIWRDLVLVVQRRSSSPTCVLCKGTVLREATPCGHMHLGCARVWMDRSDSSATCPGCHVYVV